MAVIFSGGFTFSGNFSGTEAELKATTPTVVGQQYWDETNLAIVVSTGATEDQQFGMIYNGATAPTGW